MVGSQAGQVGGHRKECFGMVGLGLFWAKEAELGGVEEA